MKSFNRTFNKIDEIFKKVLKIYPFVIFGIENVTPVAFRNNRFVGMNGFLFDNVDFVNYVNKKFNTNKKIN